MALQIFADSLPRTERLDRHDDGGNHEAKPRADSGAVQKWNVVVLRALFTAHFVVTPVVFAALSVPGGVPAPKRLLRLPTLP